MRFPLESANCFHTISDSYLMKDLTRRCSLSHSPPGLERGKSQGPHTQYPVYPRHLWGIMGYWWTSKQLGDVGNKRAELTVLSNTAGEPWMEAERLNVNANASRHSESRLIREHVVLIGTFRRRKKKVKKLCYT